jgi:hypothetical protein
LKKIESLENQDMLLADGRETVLREQSASVQSKVLNNNKEESISKIKNPSMIKLYEPIKEEDALA